MSKKIKKVSMFDLSKNTYQEVTNFLERNMIKKDIKPCVPINRCSDNSKNNTKKDLYELIIVSIDDEYFDDPDKNFNICDVKFGKCYYYILEYDDESYDYELSVLDCGGYYIAAGIFKNKENITNVSIYNKDLDGKNTFQKFHMNTLIGTKSEIIPKRCQISKSSKCFVVE